MGMASHQECDISSQNDIGLYGDMEDKY